MVTINGVNEDVAGKTLSEYLSSSNYNLQRIVVEINENIIPKTDYEKTTLNDGDVVEVVSFVGGG
ncbi:MAG: sulfur carrier protein ThiS [Lachnospiraceae bacterium]|nr:sulfur carrier protein ThiS [Lachnospiraceae bacterium]